MDELSFLTLDERAYRYIRQFTIKNIEDALVELITNSIDAYSSVSSTLKNIDINYHEIDTIQVIDHAKGLTAYELENCFLQVGKHTTSDGCRGFFSRGAKDISAIADIYFESIIDGKYSKCMINTDAYGGILVADQDVTQEDRDRLQIPKNGLSVTMKLIEQHQNVDTNQIKIKLQKLAVLRDIMSNTNNTIMFTHYNNKTMISTERLVYEYPEGEKLLEIKFSVPNYPDAIAEFVVYKAKTRIVQPDVDKYLEFGFLVKDSASVYEANTIADKFRWDPYMSCVYGYLKCDYISHLLHDFDKNGETTQNPTPVIDPSRLTGLNKEHPFIMSLLSIPSIRIDYILKNLNQSLAQRAVSINDVGSLLDELSDYGINILEKEDIKVRYVPNYEQILVKAIEDDRRSFIQTEKNYLLTDSKNIIQNETDSYVHEQLLQLEYQKSNKGSFYVYNGDGSFTELNQSQDEDPLVLLNDLNISDIDHRPYIYKISDNGQLLKLYIFEKGRIELISNPEEKYITMKNKEFQVLFINDINIVQRYLIDYSSGVTIKINVHNPIIAKHLAPDSSSSTEKVDMKKIKSNQSLIFFQELITDIFADLIVESNIVNNKIRLESNPYNNMKKIIENRNLVISQIEQQLSKMFQNYIDQNLHNKLNILNLVINKITDSDISDELQNTIKDVLE